MKPFNEVNLVKAKDMKEGDYGFQGDVVIKKIEKPNSGYDLKNQKHDGVVAEGEHTGHIHKLFGDYTLVENESGSLLLEVKETATLKHQEHNPIELYEGFYEITIQKEYDHFEEIERSVLD